MIVVGRSLLSECFQHSSELSVWKSYRHFRFVSGFAVCVRFVFGFVSGSCLVRVRFGFGFVSGLVSGFARAVSIWVHVGFVSGSYLVRIWFVSGSCLVRVRVRVHVCFVSGLYSVVFG